MSRGAILQWILIGYGIGWCLRGILTGCGLFTLGRC